MKSAADVAHVRALFREYQAWVAEPLCFAPEALAALQAMGHQVDVARGPQGSVMAISIHHGPDGKLERLEAGVDRRRADAGAAGF